MAFISHIKTLFDYHAKMTDIVYRDVLIATVAVYVAGNVIQKVKAVGNPDG